MRTLRENLHDADETCAILRNLLQSAEDRIAELEAADADYRIQIMELKAEREQWEPEWHDAADYDLCRELAEGRPTASSPDSVSGKLRAKIEGLEAMMSPEGTIRERVERLIAVAKAMGFERAGEAAWNRKAEPEYSAVESIEQDVEDGYWDEPLIYDMGLYLYETVYAYRHYDEDADEYSVVVLDDREAAIAAARKEGE